MIDTRVLKKVVSGQLEPIGFSRSGSVWRRSSDELVTIVELQKSNYDRTYFVNVGFYFKSIGAEHEPPMHHCHIQSSMEDFLTSPSDAKALLISSTEWNPSDHAAALSELFGELAKTLTRLRSRDALGRAFQAGQFERSFVMAVAEKILEAH